MRDYMINMIFWIYIAHTLLCEGVWVYGCGCMGVGVWVWVYGCGCMGVGVWVWVYGCGCGCMGVGVWVWVYVVSI
jgi:hypothetical protein